MTGDLELVPRATRKFLLHRGHILSSLDSGAVSQLIVHDLGKSVAPKSNGVFLGKLVGVSDPRKDGYPAGY